jgi:hypothetical protein
MDSRLCQLPIVWAVLLPVCLTLVSLVLVHHKVINASIAELVGIRMLQMLTIKRTKNMLLILFVVVFILFLFKKEE